MGIIPKKKKILGKIHTYPYNIIQWVLPALDPMGKRQSHLRMLAQILISSPSSPFPFLSCPPQSDKRSASEEGPLA